ncbi:MAG: hypothetical protein KH301_07520 [Brachyspira sp.]|nr:hypothetical protein [Brachyspira sp.]
MKVDFKPQRLLNVLVTEDRFPNGVRRLLQTEGRNSKIIEMEMSKLDMHGNAYPKEYYISSMKVYDRKTSKLLKKVEREVIGDTNSVTHITTKNNFGKYDKSTIVRDYDTIKKS